MFFPGVEKTENARKVYMPWRALEEENFFVYSNSAKAPKSIEIDSEEKEVSPKLVSYASSQYRHKDAHEGGSQQPASNASASMSHAQPVENGALAGSSGNGRMILKSRPRTIKCQICGKNFLKKAYLDRHTTAIHNTILKKFVCPVCSRPFESRFNLKTHGTTQHGVLFSNEDMEEIEVVNDEE